jgi:hypothetical protein
MGAYDAEGKLLRDVWTFDVASRIWSKWPDIPAAGVADIEGEGNIICTEGRLWRCGDGFGKVVYLEIVRDKVDDFSRVDELGVSPKTGNWETVSFGPIRRVRTMKLKRRWAGQGASSWGVPYATDWGGFVLITTDAGREYLLLFMGQEGKESMLRDVWSFQIASEKETLVIL